MLCYAVYEILFSKLIQFRILFRIIYTYYIMDESENIMLSNRHKSLYNSIYEISVRDKPMDTEGRLVIA